MIIIQSKLIFWWITLIHSQDWKYNGNPKKITVGSNRPQTSIVQDFFGNTKVDVDQTKNHFQTYMAYCSINWQKTKKWSFSLEIEKLCNGHRKNLFSHFSFFYPVKRKVFESGKMHFFKPQGSFFDREKFVQGPQTDRWICCFDVHFLLDIEE